MNTTTALRCRAFRLEAQNSRYVSPWNSQCPYPAKGEVTMRDDSNQIVLPACGKHIRLDANGLRSVHAYRQTSEKYERPTMDTVVR